MLSAILPHSAAGHVTPMTSGIFYSESCCCGWHDYLSAGCPVRSSYSTRRRLVFVAAAALHGLPYLNFVLLKLAIEQSAGRRPLYSSLAVVCHATRATDTGEVGENRTHDLIC